MMTRSARIQFEWYVSLDGDDKNPGTLEQPYLTIRRAANEAKKYSTSMKGDFHIWIRGGTYAQTETLGFNYEDSALNGFRIIYAAYKGEPVVISGGIRIECWKPVDDSLGRNLYKASVPGLPYSRHLYVNGKAASRPRSAEIQATAWHVAKDEGMSFWNHIEDVTTYQGSLPVHEGYRTNNIDMLKWRNPRDIEAVFDVAWTHSICPVESIEQDDEGGAIIRMLMPCFRDCQIKAGVQVGVPSYFENVFELMDRPGEWYYDRSEKAIYYYAHEQAFVNDLEFIIPVTEQLLVVKGELGQPVSGITFVGLEFCHTTNLQPHQTGHPEIQTNLLKDSRDDLNGHSAYVKVPSAVLLRTAEEINFEDCLFHRLGSGGMDIEFGSRNNVITGNEFYQIGGSGIQLGGFSFDDAHPDDLREMVCDNRIQNNYFHHIGIDFKGSSAVIAGYTEGTVIAHNEICEIAYTGVSMGWGWGYADPGITRLSNFAPDYYPVFQEPTVMKRNRIAYNHIHHVLRKLHDGGGIYTLSAQPESAIIGNYVHHNGGESGTHCVEDIVRHTFGRYEQYDHFAQIHGFPGGIYMDEATAGFEISGNIVHDVVVPIYYHEGVKGTFETLSIFGNVTHIVPNSPGFPTERASKAGLEDRYAYMLQRNRNE